MNAEIEQASKMFNDTKKYSEEIDEVLQALIGDEDAALQLFFSVRDSQTKDPFALKPFQTSIDVAEYLIMQGDAEHRKGSSACSGYE